MLVTTSDLGTPRTSRYSRATCGCYCTDIDSHLHRTKELRLGRFDVLVGINLLREGLDLPEVSLVAILDAANEGFLRSETTLIQISGRAARHLNGQVVLYADTVTGSMRRALDEMDRRRERQAAHNREHHITPRGIQKAVQDLTEFQSRAKQEALQLVRGATAKPLSRKNLPHLVDSLEHQMRDAADNLDFELAAALRDQIIELRELSAWHSPPPRVVAPSAVFGPLKKRTSRRRRDRPESPVSSASLERGPRLGRRPTTRCSSLPDDQAASCQPGVVRPGGRPPRSRTVRRRSGPVRGARRPAGAARASRLGPPGGPLIAERTALNL